MKKIYTAKSFEETQKIGQELAKEILLSKTPQNPPTGGAVVLCLNGNLGGGKTTFLQGFAKGLGIKEKILSPTFVIMKSFNFQLSTFKFFYHIDCYRLNSVVDITELGIKEILKNPENIVAIEWPEKIEKVLPKETIKIDFKFIDEQTREIKLEM